MKKSKGAEIYRKWVLDAERAHRYFQDAADAALSELNALRAELRYNCGCVRFNRDLGIYNTAELEHSDRRCLQFGRVGNLLSAHKYCMHCQGTGVVPYEEEELTGDVEEESLPAPQGDGDERGGDDDDGEREPHPGGSEPRHDAHGGGDRGQPGAAGSDVCADCDPPAQVVPRCLSCDMDMMLMCPKCMSY